MNTEIREGRKNQETILAKLAILRSIKANCENEKRLPTSDESSRANALLKDIDVLEARNAAIEKEYSETHPPDRTPIDTRADAAGHGGENRSYGTKRPYEIRTVADKKDFRSLFGSARDEYRWTDQESNFFGALFSGRYHPGLTKRAMSEGSSSDGGFLVPTEYSKKIHNLSLESELVLPRALVQPMSSNEMKLPGMEIGSHASSLYGGFTASYKPEAGTLTEANPRARQMVLKCKKLTGFLRFSNELMADAPNGEQQLLDICGKGLSWYRDKAFLKGSGAGEPLGILNAPCTLVQAKESGQSADTIQYANLVGMLAKLHPASFKNAVFVCHQSTIPQLLQLNMPVGTGGSAIPVMRESNGAFSILTKPVVFTEKTEVLGDQGDIILCDFSKYVIGLRSEMRIDLSQHVYFTSDEMAARLIERHDGMPLWDEPLTLEDGSTQVSPFVTLAERT